MAMPDTQQAAPDTQQAAPLLSPDQLNNVVAPIALYPDPLLSQVLSASTYPLEIIEAQQWLGQKRNLQGAQLAEAARQQNWDPSIQALVVFPNALALLANDVRWTTDLGNAFLAQQADVMSAVQRMRARARANGKLANTPQQVVTTATQDGRDAIEIQPADPQVIYVPVYRPAYVWGPPVWGAYPDLWYPAGFGFGFGFGPGYYMSSYYPGWGGWGGWGWGGFAWWPRALKTSRPWTYSATSVATWPRVTTSVARPPPIVWPSNPPPTSLRRYRPAGWLLASNDRVAGHFGGRTVTSLHGL